MTAPTNAALLSTLTMRGGGRQDVDLICSSLARVIARAEAFRDCGDDDRIGWALEIAEEKMAALEEAIADYRAIKSGAVS